LLQATALVSLWEQGFVEPIEAPREPYHLFVQQVLALTLQTGGLRVDAWQEWLGRFPAFRDMPGGIAQGLIEHLIDREILFSDGVLLSIGDEGEKRFGRRHFLELVSVFTSPPLFEVIHGNKSIGMVDWLTVAVEEGRERRPMILGGRAWDIREIDFSARRIFVTPSQEHGRARWQGKGRGLGFEMAQEVRQVLITDESSPRWSRRCTEQMRALRDEYRARGVDSTTCVYDQLEGRMIWWTFAGRFLNESLATILEERAGIEGRFDNFCLRFPMETDGALVRRTIRQALDDPDVFRALPISKEWLDGLKFSECLPEAQAAAAARGRVRVGAEAIRVLQGYCGGE
jgi:ATP-dependent Lhr-like helicase